MSIGLSSSAPSLGHVQILYPRGDQASLNPHPIPPGHDDAALNPQPIPPGRGEVSGSSLLLPPSSGPTLPTIFYPRGGDQASVQQALHTLLPSLGTRF